MAYYNPMEPLDITDINGVKEWHIRFSQYVKTNSKIDSTNQTAHYITSIGKQAFRLLVDLSHPNDVTTMTVADLQALIQNHLSPPNIELVERERYHSLTKKPEETYKMFTLRVQRQAAKCGFGSDLTTQLRDRLVAGIRDPELKRKFCKDNSLDFNKAKNIVEEWDAVNSAVHPIAEPLFVAKPNRHRSKSKHRPSTSSYSSHNNQRSRVNFQQSSFHQPSQRSNYEQRNPQPLNSNARSSSN